jgi:hypothetical protein
VFHGRCTLVACRFELERGRADVSDAHEQMTKTSRRAQNEITLFVHAGIANFGSPGLFCSYEGLLLKLLGVAWAFQAERY